MGKKKCLSKEEFGEDFCFVCKDGGMLRICDQKDCLKAYHFECVGQKDSFVESEDRWTCGWHSCFYCRKTPKFRCFVCPQAVCGGCISIAEFVLVRSNKGFCNHCFKLTLLIEDGKDVDSDGIKVDFKDRDTYEFLFKEYWELIKLKEGLTAEHVHTANKLMKKGSNFWCGSNSNEMESEEDTDGYDMPSDYEELEATKEEQKLVRKGKRSKEKQYTMRKKMKSNNKEFIGWGSKPIIDFLSKIGKDTSKKLSEYDVTSIITAYCKENKLFHPQKKKKILCDAKLHAVFGRKSMNIHSIHNLLTTHFAENLKQSSDDESTSSSEGEEKNENSLMPCKRPRKFMSDRELVEKEPSNVLQSQNCSAAIVAGNINLIYLKRSLVEELLKNLQCFEGKMVGSFVRVKSDPNDYSQNNPYQLLQVKGVKMDSSNVNEKQKILVQVSNRIEEYIPIYKLSDDDFSEEECVELRQRVRNGLLKKPTVAELHEKVRSLHEDITKHWIPKELNRLQTCIDHANEKGWRRELFEYMEKRTLLQKPSEQARLLHELPEVIADIPEPTFDDLLEKDKQVDHALLDRKDGRKYTPVSEVEECLIGLTPITEKQQRFEVPTCKDFAPKSCIPAAEFKKHEDQHQPILSKEHKCLETLLHESNIRKESINTQQTKLESKDASEVQLIELSDDEDEDRDDVKVEVAKQNSEDPNRPVWYCASAEGATRGPLPMSILKQWRDSSSFELKCKVWKSGQSSEEAILLSDAIRLLFPS